MQVVNALKFFRNIEGRGETYYTETSSKLNAILGKLTPRTIKTHTSLIQHVIEALTVTQASEELINLIEMEAKEITGIQSLSQSKLRIITDIPTLKGALDFPNLANIITRVIENSTPRFSIGIFGMWGTGKTTLMKMIESKVDTETVNWTSFSEEEQNKMISFIRDNYDVEWIKSEHSKKLNSYTFVFGDSATSIDNKGTVLSYPNKYITLQVEERNAYLKSNDNTINTRLELKLIGSDIIINLRERKTVTVWFDAWRYEQEESLPVIALIRNITLAVESHIQSQFKTDSVWKDVRESLKRTAIAFLQSSKLSFGIKDVATMEVNFDEVIKAFKADDSPFGDLEVFHFQANGYLEAALAKLRKIDDRYRIVILVDDLDRCLPNKALQILESIKSFFDIEGIVFVLAMNYLSLDSIIREKFGSAANLSGFDYAEKIVQLPFHVATWSREDIEKFLAGLIETELKGTIFERDFRANQSLIRAAVEKNPRQVKRFMNDIILARILYRMPIDKLIVVRALKFRLQWNRFLEFITSDETRSHFFSAYLSKDPYALERWKAEVSRFYPSFFDSNDELRKFLDEDDQSPAKKLLSVKRMEEYQRAIESVSLSRRSFWADVKRIFNDPKFKNMFSTLAPLIQIPIPTDSKQKEETKTSGYDSTYEEEY